PVSLKGYFHIFDPYTIFKWGHPRFYRKPGLAYEKLGKYRHVDFLDREFVGEYDDRYISSWDGKVSKLVVQAVDDIYDNSTNSTWRRTFIRNISPLYLRLANWPFNHIDYARYGGPSSDDWPLLIGKWFITSIAISFVVRSSLTLDSVSISLPYDVTDTFQVGTPFGARTYRRDSGSYDPIPYISVGYPKVCRNLPENEASRNQMLNGTNPISERILRPRYLCFLSNPGEPAIIMNVEEWSAQHESESNLSYIMVAYTAEQFTTNDDLYALHKIADTAARNAGVHAYWIGCSCMPEKQSLEDDVYRICDVIRGAHSLAIAVSRPNDTHAICTTDLMLQQFGRRVWTFPEVLLSPAGKDIKVYARGSDLLRPESIPKNQFAARVWKWDSLIARQLIDHYEGNLILNQLELVTVALECLRNRQTTEYLPGDHSYALMGLLRIRPKIDPTDSDFQAFARLSLANNSDQLLERVICVLPKDPNQPWYNMDDAYHAKLWDILPEMISISGIGHDDTIILDGCRAANVRWKSFSPVLVINIFSWKRWVSTKLIHTGGYVFWIAVILCAIYPMFGIPMIIYSLILLALNPYLLRLLYLGKFWQTQPWLFGFEGYMDIDTIERQIFGARLGRLKWSINASPLSQHRRNEHGDCIAVDPCTDPATKALVENAKYAMPGEQRIFTLVDSGNMTVTLFQAARPPVAFIIAGAEGGMQRAIGCSYDWTTETMYRETVLRFPTTALDSMKRVSKVKMGFKRRLHPYRGFEEVGEAKGNIVR
ncbi:uncharacterized protein K441DRAFT_531540, partial [Cenococcum geophilum 1.58]|uniref:uncharacterized protein n=1 Tax=Cenococcum geophilum 1.58 TaxID=794803 RepID=UPI00358FD77F